MWRRHRNASSQLFRRSPGTRRVSCRLARALRATLNRTRIGEQCIRHSPPRRNADPPRSLDPDRFFAYRLGPTASAIFAPRRPSGFGGPAVLSRAVWCSISAFNLAPTRMTMIESQIHIIKPITAPSEP